MLSISVQDAQSSCSSINTSKTQVMADSDNDDEHSEAWTRIRDARNIRELFHGRLTGDEAKRLLRNFEWDLQQTVNFILNCNPGELNRHLATLLQCDWQTVTAEARINVVTGDNVLKDLARRNEVGKSCRQFTCEGCTKMWWRWVPNRKLVSRCDRCKRKYDPIPRDQEWGWAEFNCECGITFYGWARMGMTTSMCFQCGQMCAPVSINPPRRRRGGGGGRRRPMDNHSCSAPNCFNRQGVGRPDQECMHPRSRPRVVQVPSSSHASTGSTVNTFLPQDDIEPLYQPSLASTQE